MPLATDPADTIRILVATDNHVGYEERDPIRKDDSWKTFDEIMNLARTQDVDMVLLGGDLFHDNKPSRKSMYQVMRSLRKNCLGPRPCELEFLSDASDNFEGAFNHVNYEDPDINISIPVFSIHGNHDDPSGEGHFCSLDLLQVAGLVNYFGRIPEADNIEAKPILLQKGRTRLALYGLGNVRDERMFRTFRDHKVKWFRPNVEAADWFNLLTVHQNHHAYTATSYLPENVLPDWMNLVPGSSVATSLVPGEAVPKHVAVLNVTGREFTVEKLRLKSVRPFITRDLDNRQEVTRRLMEVVDEMIEEATAEWLEIHEGAEDTEAPLPLVRLKVEYTASEGGKFDCENPQRFSNSSSKRKDAAAELPEGALEDLGPDSIKVDRLVHEFLAAQSLKILPQAPFGDAVNQFVTKDDKHAMETFVSESLASQVRQMLDLDSDEEDLENAMETYRARLEEQFAAGALRVGSRRLRPKPDTWDSDLDGHWDQQPDAYEDLANTQATTTTASRAAAGTRGSRTQATARSSRQDEDMLDDDDDDDDDAGPRRPPVALPPEAGPQHPPAPPKPRHTKTRSAVGRASRQTKLNFSQTGASQQTALEISDDEISDDDAFEPPTKTTRARRR
ncbi:unnamed protein product [Parascedosporium putredinis]|uniref:Double-strand break repair protein n=1 Tax=Parascedosporium putredinis TaxID=1442378 RepID=A0A9P1ME54_9PEZI|nr:unnamed protein product [Parascedosporium putredinis]CAI8004962.1 unnamed protein product [Parascedosporium putredinis]